MGIYKKGNYRKTCFSSHDPWFADKVEMFLLLTTDPQCSLAQGYFNIVANIDLKFLSMNR